MRVKIEDLKFGVLVMAMLFTVALTIGCSKDITPPDEPQPKASITMEEVFVEDETPAPEEEAVIPDEPETEVASVVTEPPEEPTEAFEIFEETIEGDPQEARNLDFALAVELKTVYFDYDDFSLRSDAISDLRETVEWMKMNPQAKIEIEGHCDERGTNQYNLSLGERRTKSVKDFMVDLGVDKSRMHTISFGEERPVCYDLNEECFSRNRRAQFLIASN